MYFSVSFVGKDSATIGMLGKFRCGRGFGLTMLLWPGYSAIITGWSNASSPLKTLYCVCAFVCVCDIYSSI